MLGEFIIRLVIQGNTVTKELLHCAVRTAQHTPLFIIGLKKNLPTRLSAKWKVMYTINKPTLFPTFFCLCRQYMYIQYK